MDDAAPASARHRLTVHDYHRMAAAGILGKDDRIELIEGDLIDMAPISSEHAVVVNRLAEAFFMGFSSGAQDSRRSRVMLGTVSRAPGWCQPVPSQASTAWADVPPDR